MFRNNLNSPIISYATLQCRLGAVYVVFTRLPTCRRCALKTPGDIIELNAGYKREIVMQTAAQYVNEEELSWNQDTVIKVRFVFLIYSVSIQLAKS